MRAASAAFASRSWALCWADGSTDCPLGLALTSAGEGTGFVAGQHRVWQDRDAVLGPGLAGTVGVRPWKLPGMMPNFHRAPRPSWVTAVHTDAWACKG